jgi:hypothetical protein
MGMDNDSGSALSGASGFPGVAALAAGVDVVAGAGVAAGAGGGVAAFGAVVVVVFGTVVVVAFDVDDGMRPDVAAPAGTKLASTLAAARTRPPVSTAIRERGFRLKMVLLLLCRGYTRPALSPRLPR